MTDNWDDLRIFLAVARYETLSAAGRQLKLDPATVGRRIARIEDQLGRSLFVRSTFGYALNLSIPIVLIEMPGTPWYKNMREIIEKRVEIIQVQMTNGRISIDRDKLVNAINASRSKINLDVAKEITG